MGVTIAKDVHVTEAVDNTGVVDVEQIQKERGVNDYLTYIAMMLVDDPEVTVDISAANQHWSEFGENITPENFDKYYQAARLTLEPYLPHLRLNLRLYFGEESRKSPIVDELAEAEDGSGETHPSPLLDRQGIAFCIKHFDLLQSKLPRLAKTIEPLVSGDTFVRLQEFLGQSEPITREDYLFILEIGVDTEELEGISTVFENLGLDSIRSAIRVLGRKLESVADFDALWPDGYREQVQELPLVERMLLLAQINKYTLAPTVQLDPLPMTVFQNNIMPKDKGVGKATDQFVRSHPDFISADLLARTTGLHPEEISQLLVDSVRVSFMNPEQTREYLMTHNPNQYADVAVLLTDCGITKCTKTERRMNGEMESGRAYMIKYIFPDGSKATIATKFEEVTMGVCLESSSPEFVVGGVYLPDVPTYRQLDELGDKSMKDFRIHRRDVNRESPTISHIWAFTRSANSPQRITYGQSLMQQMYVDN